MGVHNVSPGVVGPVPKSVLVITLFYLYQVNKAGYQYNTIQYNTNRFIFYSGHNMTYEEIYKKYSGR